MARMIAPGAWVLNALHPLVNSSAVRVSDRPPVSEVMRILICGSVNGRLNSFFSKIVKIMGTTGAFDSVFCVGEFLGEDMSEFEAYRDGRALCPVLTFFIGPTDPKLAKYYPEANGASICTNLIYLGRRGVLAAEEGLRLAYISGLESATDESVALRASDLDMLDRDLLITGERSGIDILLTSAVPAGIENLQTSDMMPFNPKLFSNLVAKLAVNLKPRYHFCNGDNVYFEAPPYRNHVVLQEKETHATRFVALSNCMSTGDQKGMYGFQITPMASMNRASLLAGAPQAMESPYVGILAAQPVQTTTYTNNYFFENQPPAIQSRTDRSTNCDVMIAPCWFCPGEQHYESHLVVSMGGQAYLSLARGGLNDNHLMIVPIEHIRSSRDCSANTLEEIDRYKSALIKFFESHDHACVFYERFLRTVHLQVQCIPIPKSKAHLVEPVFLEYLDHLNLPYEKTDPKTDLAKLIGVSEPFFLVDMPNGKRLFVRLSDESGFHLQFGRIVLASERLLNVPNRGYNWKLCMRPKTEEQAIVVRLRREFAPFDPALATASSKNSI